MKPSGNKDFAAKDAAKIAAHYASDAVLFTPGEQPLVGATAIQGAFTNMAFRPHLLARHLPPRKQKPASPATSEYTQGTLRTEAH